MRNIVRVIVYIWLVGVGGLYWYQNPNWYQDLIDRSKTQMITATTGSTSTTWDNNISWSVDTGESIIDLIAQQLSGSEPTNTGLNPFGEVYVSVPQPSQTTTWSSEGKDQWASYQDTMIPDTSVCTTPRGRSVTGGDWTLAFASDQANSDNVCVIEKRICTQWVLWGSYTQHTCYFHGQGWQYEYLWIRWSDSVALINQAELQLWISINNWWNNNTRNSQLATRELTYTDDTQWVSNYALIDASSIPSGRTSNWWYTNSNTSSLTREGRTEGSALGVDPQGGGFSNNESFDLWPIIARTPETKISAAQEQRINPNGNGTQWIIKTTANSPRLSYSTDNIKLDPTEPARGQYTCNTPRGSQTFHNQHVIAFEASSVPQWQLCTSELRTCSYGYLRWSYTHETCTIEWVNNTNTNNPYRPSRWYYDRGNYYDYNYYDDQWYYNDNRYNDRYYRTYNYSYRSPRKAYTQCIVDHYGFVGHGSTLTMYDKAVTWPGQVCNSIVRLCDDGRLSWSDDYTYGTCTTSTTAVNKSVSQPRSSTKSVTITADTNTNPWQYYRGCQDIRFGYLNHGASVKMYARESVNYNESCQYEYRTCNNGSLLWDYLYTSCSVRGREYYRNNNDINVYNYKPNTRSSYRDYGYYYPDSYYITPYRYDDYNYDYYNYRPTPYDSYVRSYGTKSDPNAWSCSVTDYGTLRNADFLVMYRETNPAAWTKCQSITRTCSNGSLSWPSDYTKLRCSETQTVCGNATRESWEQCDHKDPNKLWRWSGWCSLACTPIQQITIIEEKCYDYTDTTTLCAGKNGWTITDSCQQIRSCPTIDTRPATVRFKAWEEINNQAGQQSCEPDLSDIWFAVESCNGSQQYHTTRLTLRSDYNQSIVQDPYTIADTNIPSNISVRLKATPWFSYSSYSPNPRYSWCFTLTPWQTKDISAWFRAPISVDNTSHPRRQFDPTNGQKEQYPGC